MGKECLCFWSMCKADGIFIQVEGLAKHLRCVGIDAAIPHSKKPDPRCSPHEYIKNN